MLQSVTFPSLEQEMIRCLNELLASTDYMDTHVSILHDDELAGRQITVRSDGGIKLNPVVKQEPFSMNIWTDTLDDGDVLARLVEAILPLIPHVATSIKDVELVMAPHRLTPDGTAAQYYLTGIALVKGSTFTLTPKNNS